MDTDRVLSILAEAGVFLRGGHYVYTSGMHGSDYVDKDALYRNPIATNDIARAIADQWVGWGIDAVIGPEKGGITLASHVALCLTTPHHVVQAFYAERKEELVVHGLETLIRRHPGFVMKRGVKELRGKRVLVVEDVFNSGDSAMHTVIAAREAGCLVKGVGGIFNRGGVTGEKLGVEAFSPLLTIPLEQWPEDDCPHCKANVEVNVRPGHGAEFLLRRATEEQTA